MSLAYGELLYSPPNGCKCRVHRQHRVWQFIWNNPSASRKECARALGMSVGNVRVAVYHLRKRNLARLCPQCMYEQLVGEACSFCGYEPFEASLPLEVRADSQSPTNAIHAGNLLGSVTDYGAIGFTNHGLVLKRRIERGIESPLVRAVKSDVENELKRSYPPEVITDEAGKLCVKEVLEFRARYPGLANSKNVRKQLAENVMNRLRLLHPQLRAVTALREGAN